MKLSIKWLSNFMDLSSYTVDEIIDKAIKAGFEVEEVIKLSDASGLVVGKVIECEDHPDSDHLHITKVDIGTEVLDIVCGAPNCRKNLKVIVAKVGAKLPDGEIKAGKIRGAISNGMLCSLCELGIDKDLLSENSPSLTGIEELDDRFNVGDEDILAKLGYDDTILDLAIYANRPDCLSVFNLAKEMAAILDLECKLPTFDGKSDIGEDTKLVVKSSSKNCPHFLAKVVNKVELHESPEWMKQYLLAYGMKSINNLVDISNIVMLETGQPLHFYDLRTNPNLNIEVVDDLETEYVALDGNGYKIEKGDLMITSDSKAIGIAGIMGGDNTKIEEDTTGIIIECALFNHAQIRRTSNRLGLQTESAMRFSKGLDPKAQTKAMDRAVELLIEYANAEGFEKTVKYGEETYKPYEIVETVEHLNGLIGKEYKLEEILDVFRRLDFKYRIEDEKIYVAIPSYRAMDLKIREDLDEEVIRLTGFDDLEETLPVMETTIGKLTRRQSIRRQIGDALSLKGLNEIITYTLVDDKYNENASFAVGDSIELASPLSDARKYIRTSLMNSMLECVAYNEAHGNLNNKLFEISSLYGQGNIHHEHLGIVLNGLYKQDLVKHIEIKNDFYILKGLLLSLLSKLGYEMGRIELLENNLDTKHFHPYQSAILRMNGENLAIFGRIHPSYEKEFKIKPTYYAELNLELLVNSKGAKIKANPVNKYPSVSRDISLVVKDEVKASDLLKVIKKAGANLVKESKVFDIYKGEHIEEGYKSISISIVYEDANATLTMDRVNEIHTKVLDTLNKKYEANLRA